MKKLLYVLMALCVVFVFAACTQPAQQPPEPAPVTPPPATDPGTTTEPAPPVETTPEFHIGFATLTMSQSEDEYRGVEALIAKYGKADEGGLIKHVVLPDNFAEEQEVVISMIAGLADDPLMKAVIVNQGVQGTAAGFQKIKDAGRDDIILLTNMPQDDPEVMRNVATIIVDSDNVLRGYYDIVRAKDMGATTFVHMSFPRHMGVYVLARRRAIYEQACKDLGIEFVFETVPDPAGDIGPAGAQQQTYDMMPRLVDKYGTDAVYFTTNTALHEPIIKRVIELGALFVDQDDMSPVCGYPGATGVDLTAEAGDWPAIVSKIEADIVAKGASGRLGTWPFSFTYAASIGLGELAKDIIEGTDSGDTLADIVKNFQVVTPGCDWVSGIFMYPDGSKIDNYYLLTMDTYIYGKGYSGVMSTPVPEKYLTIDATLE